MAVLEYKGNKAIYAPELVTDLIKRVSGHSSLAKLVAAEPLKFIGKDYVIFTMDNDVNIVAESGAKTVAGAKLTTKTMVPLKVEYGIRVSDEFLKANEEKQIDIMSAFNEGFATKMARGLDIMALHGLNPRTKEASDIIGTNHFDNISNKVESTVGQEDKDVNKAIALFDEVDDIDVNGMIMAKAFRTSLSELEYENGQAKFPELGWGGQVSSLRGIPVDVNSTLSIKKAEGDDDLALIGDFRNYFKYGIAQDVTVEIIPYGDPDNSGNDLKGHNQVFIRAEAYLGWAIMDEKAFARIVKKK